METENNARGMKRPCATELSFQRSLGATKGKEGKKNRDCRSPGRVPVTEATPVVSAN
jgi:hypothetical protein